MNCLYNFVNKKASTRPTSYISLFVRFKSRTVGWILITLSVNVKPFETPKYF